MVEEPIGSGDALGQRKRGILVDGLDGLLRDSWKLEGYHVADALLRVPWML